MHPDIAMADRRRAAKPGVDDLRAVPPIGFVRARNELVTRLREAGRAAEAANVARLRRPALVPWLVNRIAATDPAGVRQLLEAAEKLRRAYRRDPRAIADATAKHRAALADLAQTAEDVLSGAEIRSTPDILRRVHSTMAAAAADRRQHAILREGRLAEELAPGGFDVLRGMPTSHLRLAEREARTRAARAETRAAREQARRQRAIDHATRRADRLREQLRALEASIERKRSADDAGLARARSPAG